MYCRVKRLSTDVSYYVAVRTSETSVDNHFTRQYIPEDNSEHHTRRRENLKAHDFTRVCDITDVYVRMSVVCIYTSKNSVYYKQNSSTKVKMLAGLLSRELQRK
jgi:hypothetical protein